MLAEGLQLGVAEIPNPWDEKAVPAEPIEELIDPLAKRLVDLGASGCDRGGHDFERQVAWSVRSKHNGQQAPQDDNAAWAPKDGADAQREPLCDIGCGSIPC